MIDETLLASATMICKVFVDILRIMFKTDLQSWISPTMALVSSPIIVTLLMISNGVVINTSSVAQIILASILVTGAAIGVTEVQKKAT